MIFVAVDDGLLLPSSVTVSLVVTTTTAAVACCDVGCATKNCFLRASVLCLSLLERDVVCLCVVVVEPSQGNDGNDGLILSSLEVKTDDAVAS